MRSRGLTIILIALLITCLASPVIAEAQTMTTPYSWSGEWETEYGKLTLNQDNDKVTGWWAAIGDDNEKLGTLTGTISDSKLSGSFVESGDLTGSFEFTMAQDGQSFTGTWHYSDFDNPVDIWSGTRLSGAVTSPQVIAASSSPAAVTLVMQLGNPNMFINERSVEIDPGRGTMPLLVDNRVYVPISAIIRNLGGDVKWDGTQKKISISLNNSFMDLWVGQNLVRVNGAFSSKDTCPFISNGRTYLPLRIVAENLNCKVNWDPNSKQITLVLPTSGDADQNEKEEPQPDTSASSSETPSTSAESETESNTEETVTTPFDASQWVGQWNTSEGLLTLYYYDPSSSDPAAKYYVYGNSVQFGYISGFAEKSVTGNIVTYILTGHYTWGIHESYNETAQCYVYVNDPALDQISSGEFVFTLSDDGSSFTGTYKYNSTGATGEWTGQLD